MTTTAPSVNSNYTPAEIQAVVQKLVISTISQPIDTLGVRRTDLTFNDVQQAAAGVFILYPNSPFYVLKLGMQRVADQIAAESAILDELLAAVSVVGRPVLPVSDVSPLFNIQAALQNLGAAAVKRAGGYSDITKTPAYQQYQSNVSTFLKGPGQSVVQNGAIVMTPQQAVGSIPGLLSQLQTAHTALVSTIQGLEGGIDDYNNVSLPSVVIQSILSNAASLVGSDAQTLNSLTPTARLAYIRQVVLNLLATQAVIGAFGKFSGPTDIYQLDGLGSAYWDVNHAATPAVLVSDLGRSYAIIAGVSDTLSLAVDGGAPTGYQLNSSASAEIDGTADDSTFIVGNGSFPGMSAGLTTPNNNELKVSVGGTTYVATLTLSDNAEPAIITGTHDLTDSALYGGGGLLDGKDLTVNVDGVNEHSVTLSAPANAPALISQLNTALQVLPAPCSADESLSNRVVLFSSTLGPTSTLEVTGGSAASVLGVPVGTIFHGLAAVPRTADQVAADIEGVLPAGAACSAYYSPTKFHGSMNIPSGTNRTWTLVLPGSSDLVALGVTTTDTATVLSGGNAGVQYPITAVSSSTITVSGHTVLQAGALLEIGPLHRRIKVYLTDPATQVPAETVLSVFGDDVPSSAACITLGFPSGISAQSGLSTPDTVAADINDKVAVVQASALLINAFGPLPNSHADILNANHVAFVAAAAVGDSVFSGTQLTLTLTSVTTGGSVSVGDTVALRTGPSARHGYVIATVNGQAASGHALAVGDVIVAHGSYAGATAAFIVVEFGPTINAQKYQVVTITGGPNGGTYQVAGTGDTAIDVLLSQPLLVVRSFTSPTTNPQQLTASIGDKYLSLASKNTTTASALTAAGTAGPLFFTGGHKTAVGTSQWFELPVLPPGLQSGDLLEYFQTDFQTPLATYTVVQILPGTTVIQVTADPSSGLFPPSNASWQFTPQPPPFAQLRYGIQNDFTQVQAALNIWLARPQNQALYFKNLNALINPLLVNSNPTAAQVGSAQQGIEALYKYLTAAEATALGQDPALALDSILLTFTIEPVPAIDTLIQTFTQKGSDRAVDILLQGQFTTFFGLSADGVSYAGAVQEALRSVAMNDLPVRKYNRSDTQTSRLVSQASSPDYEFPANAVTETIPGPQVSPPVDAGEPSNWGSTTGSSGAGSSGAPAQSGITGQNR